MLPDGTPGYDLRSSEAEQIADDRRLLRDVLPWSRPLVPFDRCRAAVTYGAGEVARCDLRRGHYPRIPHVAERGMDLPAWRTVWADPELARAATALRMP